MAEIIYPAVPFNGGTVEMTNENSSMCRLSGNRFIGLFCQNTPGALIASVFDVNDAKSVIPTVTSVRQQVLREFVPTNTIIVVRVWRLSSTSILVGTWSAPASSAIFDVYGVNASTGELIRLTTSSVTHATLIKLPNSLPYTASFELTDNQVLITTGTLGAIVVGRFVFNPATNVLTYSQLESLTFTGMTYQRGFFYRKLGTTDEAMFSVMASTANSASTPFPVLSAPTVRLYSITPSSFTVKAVPALNTAIMYSTVIGMRTATKGYATDGSYYCEYDWTANTFNAKQSKFVGSGETQTSQWTLVDIIPLSENYMCLISSLITSTVEPFNLVDQSVRFVKYTDHNLAQCSATTSNSTKGIQMARAAAVYRDKPAMELWGTDKLVQMCLKSSNEFSVRTMWFD